MAIIELTPSQIENRDYLTLANSSYFFMGCFGSSYPIAYFASHRVFIVDTPEDECGPLWEIFKSLEKKDEETYNNIHRTSIESFEPRK
jgi:hypothetical protein